MTYFLPVIIAFTAGVILCALFFIRKRQEPANEDPITQLTRNLQTCMREIKLLREEFDSHRSDTSKVSNIQLLESVGKVEKQYAFLYSELTTLRKSNDEFIFKVRQEFFEFKNGMTAKQDSFIFDVRADLEHQREHLNKKFDGLSPVHRHYYKLPKIEKPKVSEVRA